MSLENLTARDSKESGDSGSEESIELLKWADIVVTNPPLSLFKEFVAQLIKCGGLFLADGNVNAVTCRNVLIQNNRAWPGVNLGRGMSGFIASGHYTLYGAETDVDLDGNRIAATNDCLWPSALDCLNGTRK